VNEGRRYQGFDERSDRGSSAGLGLTLLFVGLGIGAITALLLAPDSGRKVRKKLRRSYEDARDMLGEWTEQANEAWEKGSDWADDARERVSKRVRPIRKTMFR
jgi:gas vesicle protein